MTAIRDTKLPKTVDLTPTPKAYKLMLEAIIQGAENEANRQWAGTELERIMPNGKLVEKWGVQDEN